MRWRRRRIYLLLGALAGSTASVLSLAIIQPRHADAWLVTLVFLSCVLIAASALMSVVSALHGSATRFPVDQAARQFRRGLTSTLPGRVRVPHQLPFRLRQFCGRDADLSLLLSEFDRQARGRPGGRAAIAGRLAYMFGRPPRFGPGPAIVLIDGMPGVGKTALAQQLAHQMKARFPDGQLYANLGFGGGRRAPADVLRDFLRAMGLADHQIPDNTAERVNVFRSLTAGRRLLVVLDAARGSDQVRHLLPAGDRCAVIVTSRSSIATDPSTFRYTLDPPNTAEALDILAAFSGADPLEAAVAATEIVDYTGALPLALRSAGDQIAAGRYDMTELAAALEDPRTRLSVLRYQARDIGERIDSEYERLSADEQRALRLLSAVESPTFGSWVLDPLMRSERSDPGYADRMAARLATYHLARDSGWAGAGLAHYSLHPLVWLTAWGKLQGEAAQGEQAKERLYSAYLAAASAVLGLDEDSDRWPLPPTWERFKEMWLPAVRKMPDRWVRAEYCTLVRSVSFAHDQGAWVVAWQTAARLGACVTSGLPPEDSLAAFDTAGKAAEKDSNLLGQLEVLLARASFLVAVEWYQEAFENLRAVLEAADAALEELGPLQARRLWASAHRRKAEAWLQIGDYARAADELDVAASAVGDLAGDLVLAQEGARIEILLAENNTWRWPSEWRNPSSFREHSDSDDDSVRFQAVLGLAEQARRRYDWDAAHMYLSDAYRQNYGDERRIANVQYRTARLFLSRSRNGSAAEQQRVARAAVGYASDAVRILHKMKNPAGIVRAEALLVRALRLAGYKHAAHVLADELRDKIVGFGSEDPAAVALQARVWRCTAEVLMDDAEYDRAAELFSRAIEVYRAAGDWHSVSDVFMSLAAAQTQGGHRDLAQQSLLEAGTGYSQGSDLRALDRVTEARQMLSRRRRTLPSRFLQRLSS